MDIVECFDEVFEQKDFTSARLAKGDYEGCLFKQCQFTESDLSEIRFIDCEFIGCNLSNVKLQGTSFQQVRFDECKLLGLHFEHCDAFAFGITCKKTQLMPASFYQCALANTIFEACDLTEADFTQANLTNAVFNESTLNRAIFDQTILEQADVSRASGIQIDPTKNKLRGAKFSRENALGLLQGFGIEVVD
ncbi:pentapeptide repeat-containing protein [Gangjinia marincola]|uniref:Pentapeptide repeat-containing protein n=1 Tax=Gangjinia marincola TaxID=578463 RepID=A0ABN1MFP7_9FLAO